MISTSPPPQPQATPRRSLRPTLDPRQVRELEALRPAVRARVLAAYRRDAPTVMSAIERALELGDATGVRDGAHRLKSSSAVVGALTLGKLYGELEAVARSGRLENAGALMPELRGELGRVLNRLSSVGDG